jgi:rare lipoprotein A
MCKPVGLRRCVLLLLPVVLHAACSVSPRFRSVPTEHSQTTSSTSSDGMARVQEGIASYYADKYHGRATASGEIFDMHKVSAAHQHLPLGTLVRVTNLRNQRTLEMTINDRGPFIKGRILDVSYKAAQELDFVVAGTTPVRIEVLEMGQGRR